MSGLILTERWSTRQRDLWSTNDDYALSLHQLFPPLQVEPSAAVLHAHQAGSLMGSIDMVRTPQVVGRPFAPTDSRPRGGRRLPALLLSLSTALLAACGEDEPPEPLVMEPAPAEVATQINLDLPVDPSGAFVFDQWPKACDLLTDADIKVVLPQLTQVTREPEDQQITLLPEISNDVVYVLPLRTVTATGAHCEYDLELPATGMQFEEEGGFSGASLRVYVDYAGTPEAVEQNFSVASDAEPIEVPDGECYASEGSAGLSCRKGSLTFSISSDFEHLIFDRKSNYQRWTDHYQVKGGTTTFTAGSVVGSDSSSDGSLAEFQRSEEFRRDHLDVELAKTVLAKF